MTPVLEVFPRSNGTRYAYDLDPDRWPGYMRAILQSVRLNRWTGRIPEYVRLYLENQEVTSTKSR